MSSLKENGRYRAALYVRLSKEDGDKEESDSIKNQKALIRSFLVDKPEITICMECVDDGYSGVGFDRPGFKRMMREIDAGNINCVIVKDLSRFGRNFVETGRYIEQIFPALGIRFLAVNDHFDSESEQSYFGRILIPFKNLMNDAYCRDISIKVRSQLEIKRRKGDFVGAFAVYGYVKDASDRHRLMIDEYAAGVVRDIFLWKLEGVSQQRIADRLNEKGELSPMEYKRLCGLTYKSGFQLNFKTIWTAVAVGRILCNEVYTGTLVQGRRTTPNHKVKKVIQKPEEEWARVENCHPAIIEKEDFLAVKRLLKQDTRVAPGKENAYLFSGLLFCGDCGQSMVRSSVRKQEKTYVYYMCGSNRLNKKCSSHRISEKELVQSVLLSIRALINAFVDKAGINADIVRGGADGLMPESGEMQRSRARLIKKQEEIARCERLKEALREALCEGLIDSGEYAKTESEYENRITDARIVIKEIERELEETSQNHTGGDGKMGNCRMEEFEGCQNLSVLTRHLVVNLIESIIFYEKRRMNIRFRCRDALGQVLVQEKNRKKLCPVRNTDEKREVV